MEEGRAPHYSWVRMKFQTYYLALAGGGGDGAKGFFMMFSWNRAITFQKSICLAKLPLSWFLSKESRLSSSPHSLTFPGCLYLQHPVGYRRQKENTRDSLLSHSLGSEAPSQGLCNFQSLVFVYMLCQGFSYTQLEEQDKGYLCSLSGSRCSVSFTKTMMQVRKK